MNMRMSDPPRRSLSPLWIVALFLSFCETVLGVAVMQTSGGIQVALTAFVILFPLIVSGAFFIILWSRPQVFYTPTEFGKVDMRKFVEAMQLRSQPSAEMSYSESVLKGFTTKMESLLIAFEKTGDPNQQVALILEGAVDAANESVIRIDSHPLFGYDGRVWEEPFYPDMSVKQFLDKLYFAMQPWGLAPFSYGDDWAVKNVETDQILIPAGKCWAELNGKDEDLRTIGQLGLRGGTLIQVVALRRIVFEPVQREY